MRSDGPEPELDFPTPVEIAAVTARCDERERTTEVGPDAQKHEAFEPSDLLESVVRERYSPPSFTPWLQHTEIRDIPIVPDDRPR